MSSSLPIPSLPTDKLQASALQAYRTMLLSRVLEDKLASLYRAGKIVGGVFRGKGQEAVSAALGHQLRRGDIFAPLIRDQAGRLAFGDTVLDTMRTYLGSQSGPMRGRDGNVHRGRPTEGYYAMISHLGAMVSAVAGGLMARRMRGESGVVGATSIGDGGTSTGSFHEGFNMAAVSRLPLVMVIVNNQYAYSTPTSGQYACETLCDRARGYGVAGYEITGWDLRACVEVMAHAVDEARQGRGPQMVVANVLRLVGHSEHDDASYMDPTLKDTPVGRDCLEAGAEWLLEEGWITNEELAAWRLEAENEVEEVTGRVLRDDVPPDPSEEDWVALRSRHLTETWK